MCLLSRSSFTHEEGVEGETNDIGGEGEHHEVDLDVLDGHDETVEHALLGRVLVRFSDVLEETELGDLELLLGEAAGVGWEVGKEEGSEDSNEHCGSALNWEESALLLRPTCALLTVEQPSPSGVAEHPVHVGEHASGDQRGERV